MANSFDDILSPEFGAALQAARENKRLQIEEAAIKLRMNPVFIEHMERGNFHLLPPEPYRKGFIKSYAQLVDVKLTAPLPPSEKKNVISTTVAAVTREAVDITKEVVESTVKTTGTVVQKFEEGVKDTFEEITSRDLWVEADEVRKERLGKQRTDDLPTGFSIRKREPAADVQPTVQSEGRRSYTAATPPATEPISDESYSDEDDVENYTLDRQGMSRSTKTIVGLLIVIAGIFAYSLISKKSEPPIATITPTVSLEEPKKERAKKEEVIATPPDEVQIDSTAIVNTSDSLVFSVTAKDSVWLSITPDKGFGGFRGKMKIGETRTFVANEKFLVYMGNQKAVTMKLNGERLSSLPTVENSSLVVRNVVLTKDKAYIKPEDEKIFEAKSTPGGVVQSTKKPKSTSTPKKQTPSIKRTIPNVQPVLPNAN